MALEKGSQNFAMGKTFVKRVFDKVCSVLGECLGHLIALLIGHELVEVMEVFHDQCVLPNICDFMDMNHISIKAHNIEYYWDNHKFNKYTMCLQVVCDAS